jgi:CheY-like chemotaxis protein
MGIIPEAVSPVSTSLHPHPLSTGLGPRSLSIIVADDVEGITHLVQHWLEEQGHHVTCASSGSEVAVLLKQKPVDLMITDIIMPDGDGLEVMLELKKSHPNARVLAISGGGAYLRARDCLNLAKGLGANAVLMKPFNREQLLAAVKAACAEVGSGR